MLILGIKGLIKVKLPLWSVHHLPERTDDVFHNGVDNNILIRTKHRLSSRASSLLFYYDYWAGKINWA